MTNISALNELRTEGYTVFRQALNANEVSELKLFCLSLYERQEPNLLEEAKSLGSLIKLSHEPWSTEVWADPKSLSILNNLGATDLKYSNSYFFNKAPQNPPTFWHQDWWAWNEISSYTVEAPQVGLIKILDNTAIDRGAIRVMPRSHRNYSELHTLFSQLDKKSLRRAENIDSPIFQAHPRQELLELKAGDVLAMDARLLHGTEPNLSGCFLGLITSWYYPNHKALSEPIRAAIGTPHFSSEVEHQLSIQKLDLLPVYNGNSTPTIYSEFPDPTLLSDQS
jgi:hypothetical protein